MGPTSKNTSVKIDDEQKISQCKSSGDETRRKSKIDEAELMSTSFGNLAVIQTPDEESEDNPSGELKKKGWRKYAGIMFSLLAALCFSLSGVASKMLIQRNYNPFIIGLWRYQGTTLTVPFYVIYLWVWKKQNVFEGMLGENGKTLFFLLIRGTLGFLGLTFFVFALQYLKLADATVISCSTPIAVTLFARIFLGEACGIVPTIATFITLAGVVVLSRPPLLTGEESFDERTLIGMSLACMAMLALTAAIIVVRYLRKVHFTLPLLFFGFVASIESLIFCLINDVLEMPRTWEDFWIAALAALIVVIAQLFVTLSLKYEEAGPVALVRTFDVVYAFLLQLIFLGVYPDAFSIIGASIVTIGVVFTTFRKYLSTLSEKHSLRINCWFMLK